MLALVYLPENSYLTNARWSLSFDDSLFTYNQSASESADDEYHAHGVYGLSDGTAEVVNIGLMIGTRFTERTLVAACVFDVNEGASDAEVEAAAFTLSSIDIKVCDADDEDGLNNYAPELPADVYATIGAAQEPTPAPVMELTVEKQPDGTVLALVYLPENSYLTNGEWSLSYNDELLIYDDAASQAKRDGTVDDGSVFGMAGDIPGSIGIAAFSSTRYTERTCIASCVFTVADGVDAVQLNSAVFTLTAAEIKACSAGDINGDNVYLVELPPPVTVILHTHVFATEWTVITPATCIATGVKAHCCTGCDEVADVTVIGITGHTPGAAATCLAGSVCTVCGEAVEAALGHSFGAYTVVTAATCTADGTQTATCERCSFLDSRTVPALGHDNSDEWTTDTAATCTATGSKSHHCSRCDVKSDVTEIPLAEHNYAAVWTTDTEATFTQAGSESRHCTNPGCDACTDVREIPVLAPVVLEPKPDTAFAVVELEQEGEEDLRCVSGVAAELTAQEILDSFDNTNAKLLSSTGEELLPDAPAGTGTVVTLFDNSGNVVDELVVIVKGDIDGNAKITTDDARNILRTSVGLSQLNGVYAAAAKVTDSEKLSTDDARAVLRASVGLQTIS